MSACAYACSSFQRRRCGSDTLAGLHHQTSMPNFTELFVFIAVGAFAQLVDGALGMAYGVTSAGLLMGLGVPPVSASASVHYAETFTCGASGLSHLLAGNV